MDEFDAVEYRAGYAAALSFIDTYGVEYVRTMGYEQFRSEDYVLGFQTCIGVTFERQLQG